MKMWDDMVDDFGVHLLGFFLTIFYVCYQPWITFPGMKRLQEFLKEAYLAWEILNPDIQIFKSLFILAIVC